MKLEITSTGKNELYEKVLEALINTVQYLCYCYLLCVLQTFQ